MEKIVHIFEPVPSKWFATTSECFFVNRRSPASNSPILVCDQLEQRTHTKKTCVINTVTLILICRQTKVTSTSPLL